VDEKEGKIEEEGLSSIKRKRYKRRRSEKRRKKRR